MKLSRIFAIVLIQFIILIGVASVSSANDNDCGDWAQSVLPELGCMSIASGNQHGQCKAHGIVENQEPLSKFGFIFKTPPYRVEITSLGSGRYNISLQAMSDRNDHQEKEVRFESAASSKLPQEKAGAVPEGKYKYNITIDHDMRQQLGIASFSEIFGKVTNFVDIIVIDPEKLAGYGFPLLKPQDTRHQLLYLGNNRWKLSGRQGNIGPKLVYENAKWRAIQ